MKAKYFTAGSREAVEQMAITHFACGKEQLTIDIISGDQEGETEWQILAIQGTPASNNNLNAFYAVYYEPDGVYLEVYEERGAGTDLDRNELMQHLNRKRIVDLSLSTVQNLLEKKSGRARIAMTQKEYRYGEDMSVEISSDDLEATARLLAPEPGGPVLDFETAKNKLKDFCVPNGSVSFDVLYFSVNPLGDPSLTYLSKKVNRSLEFKL